jgi:hypothetical protein
MQMAYSQGKYKQQKLISDIYPSWKYSQIERSTKRHDHSLLNNKVFRHDDPIWKKIYPPSGFGCKCSVIPIKENSNLQDGSQYLDELNDSKDFQMTPLDAWKVDTTKYVEGIREQLQKFLKTESKPEIDLQDSILDQDYLKELDKAGFASTGAEVIDHHMLAEKAGFTEKPDTMPSSEIESLTDDGYYTCYRGTGKIEYYDTFKNGDYFSGRGVFGSGTYTAINKAESYGYTDTGKIMKILFPKSARIVNFNKLLEEQQEFFKNELPKLAKKKRLNINQVKRHLSDIGMFAIFRNYDAIYMESHEYLIIQNRSICIAQNELEDVL